MKIVYIAHPIGGDVKGNVRKILAIVKKINLNMPDVVPFAPYIADVLAMDDDIKEQRERGIKNDKEILMSGIVKELWLYGRKISGGMEDEIETAFDYNIPVIVMDPDMVWPIWLRFIAIDGLIDCPRKPSTEVDGN